MVDLSVGTPVDPTPDVVQRALCDATDAPGYPQTWGTPQLREAVSAWFARRRGVPGVDPDAVLPTIGSKELVAWLPTLLGLGAGDTVVHPQIAYPTYDVGARLAGARALPADGTAQIGPARVSLYWLNSPSNPTGRVLGLDHLAKVVAWARQRGVVVASDECYAELGWDPEWADGVPSILDPRVCGGSQQSNLAGYRAGFVAGDPVLVDRLLQVRKHAGMIVPLPVQRAMVAALGDDEHVAVQRERYARRRAVLRAAVETAGLRVDHSVAGLYLWATADEPAAITVDRLAELGILVAPGTFYGPGGGSHVRIAFTATDERIDAAAVRLQLAPLRH
jgi:succinyldiaminopimelate transaminase